MLIREKDKSLLVDIFAAIEMPFEVWAWNGSRVNGTAHATSDLDLVLRTANLAPLPSDLFSNLCEKIRDSNIPILITARLGAHSGKFPQKHRERA